MTKRRLQCLTVEDGTPVDGQHKKPCSDCPWRRNALPGWLGMMSPQSWVETVHSEERIDCHTRLGAQCAGAAIYRTNVAKMPRDRTLLLLPADKTRVFSSPAEFLAYHCTSKKE